MLEGIEPTVSTMPLGSTNKIVSGDRPSTVSGNHSQHTISFSSECDWIPCGVIATVSNHSLPYSSVIRCDRWSTLATHLPSLCLGVLFSPSDPWNSSQSPSHRPSTFELCDFYLCLLVKHIRIKTLLVTRGECPENLTLPILSSQVPHIMYTFIFLLLKVFILNLLTQPVHQVSSVGAGFVALIRRSGKESNLTQPMVIRCG